MNGKRMPPPGGFVLWEGPSRLDGRPIGALVTVRSENRKTGPMLQTWILPRDQDPIAALRSGLDTAVCGACPLRGVGGRDRACYVNVLNGGPLAVYKQWRSGYYPALTESWARILINGRMVRLGAYGDPVAVPLGVWTELLAWCGGHTGYTHQWRRMDSQDYAGILMASVESRAERDEAQALGWRTYRILADGERAGRGETVCPYTREVPSKRTCAQCLACDGSAAKPGRASIVIPVHGSPPVLASAHRILSRNNAVDTAD